jgi:hypothetical protein
MRRSQYGLIVIGMLSLAAPSMAVTGAPSAPAAQWRVVATTPGFLDAVIAPTATSAWALGWVPNERKGTIAPVARHWDGHTWTSVTMPSAVRDSGMACAGASSPDNVWAFYGAGASLANPPATAGALRLENGQWVPQHAFGPSYVTGCNVLGPSDVWVFGGQVAGLGPGVGTWHLTSSGWASLNTGSLVLFGGSVVSANDIWAAGADITSPSFVPMPVLGRWNGQAWVEDRSIAAVLPKPTSTRGVGLVTINALSDSDVWVQAGVGIANTTRVIVVHWDGQGWHRVSTASFGYHLADAVPDGHGGWWAPPYVQDASAPFLWHGVDGHWTRFPLPTSITNNPAGIALAHVPQSAAMLGASSNTGRHGVILASGTLPH